MICILLSINVYAWERIKKKNAITHYSNNMYKKSVFIKSISYLQLQLELKPVTEFLRGFAFQQPQPQMGAGHYSVALQTGPSFLRPALWDLHHKLTTAMWVLQCLQYRWIWYCDCPIRNANYVSCVAVILYSPDL